MRSRILILPVFPVLFLLSSGQGEEVAKSGDSGIPAANVKVKAFGLQVIAPGFADGDAGTLTAFSMNEGTHVALLLTIPQGGFISFDEEGSKIESFSDDAKTNLLERKDVVQAARPFGSFPKITKDGKKAVIEVEGASIPKAGAKSVHLKGILNFQAGAKIEKIQTKNVAAKAETDFKVGDLSFAVKEATRGSGTDEPMEIKIESKQSLEGVLAMRLLDSAGQPIEFSETGNMKSQFNDRVTEERTLRVAKKVDKFTLEISRWVGVKAIKVPVDLNVGLGLSAE